jgi:hypothetical protein
MEKDPGNDRGTGDRLLIVMINFADKVIGFNRELHFTGKFPRGFRIMNPFRENPGVLPLCEFFYRKFYNDSSRRKLILGINPGRHGAGATGIPFTDTKRLATICSLSLESVHTHEPSSVFIYDMINRYGGPEKFYSDFYINSVCPLGFLARNEKGNWVNGNYYDDEALFRATRPFIISSLRKQAAFGVDTRVCFVLGKKNTTFLNAINEEEKIFDSLVTLEHPRYVEQYKSKEKQKYIAAYLNKFAA